MMAAAVAAALLVVLAAWLRAAGSAVSQLPRADAYHDAAEEVRGAAAVASVLDDRSQITPAVGMANSAIMVIATLLAAAVVYEEWSGSGVVLALVGTGLVMFMLGDLLPRIIGRSRPKAVSYKSGMLLAGAVRLGGWAAERLVDDNGNSSEPHADEDEDERLLIQSVLHFSETIVREVMVPRLDMVTVDVGADGATLVAAAVDNGYSRLPVTDGEEVVGIFLVKDVLPGVLAGHTDVDIGGLMRPPMFVPEVKQIAELLTEMRALKTHMAIVVDEFGAIAGLVTIEDLLEELVGEIADETDDEEIWVDPLGEGSWRVDARLSVENLADLLESDLPEGDWDTVAGLVLGMAERVPEESERFEAGIATLTVARMQGRRVAEVIVTRNGSNGNEG